MNRGVGAAKHARSAAFFAELRCSVTYSYPRTNAGASASYKNTIKKIEERIFWDDQRHVSKTVGSGCCGHN